MNSQETIKICNDFNIRSKELHFVRSPLKLCSFLILAETMINVEQTKKSGGLKIGS